VSWPQDNFESRGCKLSLKLVLTLILSLAKIIAVTMLQQPSITSAGVLANDSGYQTL